METEQKKSTKLITVQGLEIDASGKKTFYSRTMNVGMWQATPTAVTESENHLTDIEEEPDHSEKEEKKIGCCSKLRNYFK